MTSGQRDVLFSVILPTRNRPGLLSLALDSVLAQTLPDWELIVVDDASEPAAVVPADERIQLMRLPIAGGPAHARNRGVASARGRYLSFLDDDDVFTPDRLELALPGFSRAPIVVCQSRFIEGMQGAPRTLSGHVGESIPDGSTPSLGATTLERSAWIDMDERWHSVEDVEWWLRITATAPVTTVPSVGYLIRQRAADVSKLRDRAEENQRLLEAHRAYFEHHRRALAFRYKRIGLLSLAAGDRAGARRAFGRSLRTRPTLADAWHLLRSSMPRRSR